jgi:hypothetical protein
MTNLRARRIAGCLAAGAALFCAAGSLAQTPKFHVTATWHIGGDGGWDYLTADPAMHRLYIARGNRVQVVDTNTGKLAGEIAGMDHTHGIALNSDGKTGYVSDGGAGLVRVFDRATLRQTATIPAQKNPDAILFDPATHRVFAFNGRSQSATVIDTRNNSVLGTIPLPGKPEFAQADGAGNVFVNIEDKSELARIDAHTMKVTATWPLAPCESPSGLSIDTIHHRLFSVCDNKVMAVVDSGNGHRIASVPIGNGPDATRYDAHRRLVFSPNGEDGTLTVIRQETAFTYLPVQTVQTQKGARTMALDPASGDLYLVTAQFGPRPAATAAHPHPWPRLIPGTFVVLVLGTK